MAKLHEHLLPGPVVNLTKLVRSQGVRSFYSQSHDYCNDVKTLVLHTQAPIKSS